MNTNLIFSFYEEQLVSSEAFSDKRCLKGTRACTIYVMYILYMCECVNEHYGARRLCFNPLFVLVCPTCEVVWYQHYKQNHIQK